MVNLKKVTQNLNTLNYKKNEKENNFNSIIISLL